MKKITWWILFVVLLLLIIVDIILICIGSMHWTFVLFPSVVALQYIYIYKDVRGVGK